MEAFFRPGQKYIVGGASSNPDKFGYKVLKWYTDRDLPVTPVNPRRETILGLKSVDDIRTILETADGDIGISLVTPPAVSEEILNSIAAVGSNHVQSIWFQPGTYSPHTIELAKKTVPNVIQDCILVNGDKYLSRL